MATSLRTIIQQVRSHERYANRVPLLHQALFRAGAGVRRLSFACGLTLILVAGCRGKADQGDGRSSLEPAPLRPIRVLLSAGVNRLHFHAASGLAILPTGQHADADEEPLPLASSTAISVSLRRDVVLKEDADAESGVHESGVHESGVSEIGASGAFPAADSISVKLADGKRVICPLPAKIVSTRQAGTVPTEGAGSHADWLHVTLGQTDRDKSSERAYPGWFYIDRVGDDALEVINYVDLERYVAVVVAHELLPTFRKASFQVGAIVARTFAVREMRRMNRGLFDVRSTQGSQVYGGFSKDKAMGKGESAARETRGLVCAWSDGAGAPQLFTTFYSAVCGGVSQSAAIFGETDPIPPLQGGVACDYCRVAPASAYRWGPVELSLAAIDARLRKASDMDDDVTRPVSHVEIDKRSPRGRVQRVRIMRGGEAVTWTGERFRHAVGPSRIRSTMFDLAQEGDTVVFRDGKGFGHGLGLCQWGMEGQAREGREAAEILRYYYPGSVLTRLY